MIKPATALVPNYDLKWLREYAGLTQQEAAEQLHVNRVTYANYERGVPEPGSSAAKKILSFLAKSISADVSLIPPDLAEKYKQNEEASAFAKEVKKIMSSPNQLKVETLVMQSGCEGEDLPSLPPIEVPLHLFRPSTMKRFNVPEERWVEYVREKPGESVEGLKLAGYSWDQAVEWISSEKRAQAFALLKIWEQARNQHFKDRARTAKEKKQAMAPLVYKEIVAIFEGLLDEQGWGLV